MSFGLQLRDAAGGLTFDSNSFTVRMVYRVAVTTNPGASTVVTVPNFDGAKGVVWLDVPDFNGGTTVAPGYSVSGATVTILPYSAIAGLYLNAVMFS